MSSHFAQDELAARIHELETIAQISTAVSSILNLDELLHQVLVRTRDQFHMYHVNIALIDATGTNLVPIMADNDMLRIHSTSDVPPIPIDKRPSIVARVARERIVLLTNNVYEDPDFMPHPLLPDTLSELTVPMIVGSELIGILDVQAAEVNRFSEADVRIYTTLAAQLAIAIQNARTFEQVQQRTIELTVLNEMGRELNSAAGIGPLLWTFYEHASRLVDTTNLFVALYEPEERMLGEISFPLYVVEGVVTEVQMRRPFGNGLTEHIIKTKRPLLIEAHVGAKLQELGIERQGPVSQSWMGAPLIHNEFIIGVIGVQSFTTPYAFNENSLRLLVSMANQIALAVANARLLIRTQDQAYTLEQEVARQTEALRRTNKRLNVEIAEKQQAEEALRLYAAELERSNQELQHFASVASHDLQEPLRKIIAFSDRLTQRYTAVLDNRGLDYLQRMQSAALRMQTLIHDLLAYSRVANQTQPFTQLSLNDILQNVMADLEHRIEETQATIYHQPLPDIEGDPTQIRQLLQNLLGNALKFRRPDVSPIIHITSTSIIQNGQPCAQIVVQDNGIGIAPAYQVRIFEIFERLESPSAFEGSGIGLAICRKIVDRHNGVITVESVPGQGAAFIVCLPIAQLPINGR